MIRVIIKEPGKPAEQREIENNLETLQELVGGYIEDVNIGSNILVIVNEEGKLKHLDFNFVLGFDIICGTAVFIASEGEEFSSLTQKQTDFILTCLKVNSVPKLHLRGVLL